MILHLKIISNKNRHYNACNLLVLYQYYPNAISKTIMVGVKIY